jgi:hypothetical protein
MADPEVTMTCAEWQERIALDDPGADEHIIACEACRDFERDIRAVNAALGSLRHVEEAAVTRIRSGVLSKLRARRRWLTLVPVAAMLAVLLFGWTLLRLRVQPLHFRAPAIAAAPLPPALSTRPSSPPARRRAQPAPPPTAPAEKQEVVVTLFTEDPDVVIVWITD